MDKKLSTTLICDLGCATAIVCEGILPLELIKDQNSPQIAFLFEDIKLINKIEDNYWLGRHKCVSREYFENLKMLKNRIYTLKNNA